MHGALHENIHNEGVAQAAEDAPVHSWQPMNACKNLLVIAASVTNSSMADVTDAPYSLRSANHSTVDTTAIHEKDKAAA